MQKRVLSILVLCLFENLTFSEARYVDPLALALDQILADITFEIVPYPTYPNACPTCSNIYYDIPNQCGYNPNICPNIYDPCGQCANICANPYDQYGQCGFDRPACNSYRDIKNPCSVLDDSLYICFENCACGYDMPSPPPYIYFPEVEYPMSAMDIRPYYYGSCWCY